jgi:glycine cleavage system H protein
MDFQKNFQSEDFPDDLKYTKNHEWLRVLEGGAAEIGLTDFAQDSLGDMVFVNLPEVGDEVTAGEAFADVESVKAVWDIFSPVTGSIDAVNDIVFQNPAAINAAPYETWLVRVKGAASPAALMTASEYRALIGA